MISKPARLLWLWHARNLHVNGTFSSLGCTEMNRCTNTIWYCLGSAGMLNHTSVWKSDSYSLYRITIGTIHAHRAVKHGNRQNIYHDVMKWKHFPRYWPFARRIHRSSVNSPHKGQWRGALMFSLICVWINGWVNNGEAGDLRHHLDHYDVIVMN